MSNFTKTEDPQNPTDWDTKDVFSWAADYYDFDNNRTKLRPDQEFVRTGLLTGEPWARTWLNDVNFNHGQYLNWVIGVPVVERSSGADEMTQVENREAVGTVKVIDQTARDSWYDALTAAAETPAQLLFLQNTEKTWTVDQCRRYWGGTWTEAPAGTFTKTDMDIHQDVPTTL